MRDYLQVHGVEFDDRNIRLSPEARQDLLQLTGDLVVPVLVMGDRRVVGFDPEGIDDLVNVQPHTNSP